MKPVPFKGTANYIVYGTVKVFRCDIMHEQYTKVTGKCKIKDVAVHHMMERNLGGGEWYLLTYSMVQSPS